MHSFPLYNTFQGDCILGFDLVYLILLLPHHFNIFSHCCFCFVSVLLFAAGCVSLNILLDRRHYTGLFKVGSCLLIIFPPNAALLQCHTGFCFCLVFCFKLYILKSPCCSYPDLLEELCFSNNLLLQYAP